MAYRFGPASSCTAQAYAPGQARIGTAPGIKYMHGDEAIRRTAPSTVPARAPVSGSTGVFECGEARPSDTFEG